MRRSQVIAALVALALSGSAEAGQRPTPDRSATVAGSPSAAVDEVYRKFVFAMGDYRKAPWSAELRNWLARDDRATPRGEVGVFDWVPFCGCQDTPTHPVHTKTISRSGSSARVEAFLGRDRFVYDMRLEGNRWVIADIHSHDTPSILLMLRRAVPREEARVHR